MSPTPWMERSTGATLYSEGVRSSATFTGLMLFDDIPFPMVNAIMFVDPTTTYAERTAQPPAGTERTAPAPAMTERNA